MQDLSRRVITQMFPWLTATAMPVAAAGTPVWEGFPHVDRAKVRDVVGAAHTDLAKVKELVAEHPTLARATWDWGYGDFETALGAASHVGRVEVAEFLLERGASLDIFAAAMLGMTAVVEAIVKAKPGIQRTLGPHGIPLLAHAKSSGARAKSTGEYLETLGDAGQGIPTPALDDERRKIFVGVFRIAGGPRAEVKLSSPKQLSLIVTDPATPYSANRWIHHAGNEEFYPAGAPAVRVKFTIENGKAAALSIVDGPHTVTAAREA